MKIAIDIDGVIAADKYMFRRYIEDAGFEYAGDYSINDSLQVDSKVFKEGIPPQGFFLALNEITGAYEFIKQLHEEGHELYGLTNRRLDTDAMPETIIWLEQRKFPPMLVIFNDNGQYKDPAPFKVKTTLKFKFDVVIDDYINNIESIDDNCTGTYAILFEGDWSKVRAEIEEIMEIKTYE